VTRISTPFEICLSATLLNSGFYMLHEGVPNKSPKEAPILIGGAVCSTLGLMKLTSAVRSILWRRRMVRRHSIPND